MNNTSWQQSITRSCRGNASYKFENKIFDSDIARLKIEIFLISKTLQNQILSPTLKIVYQGNFDDEVFTLNIGDTKPSTTLIENLKPCPFKLQLYNSNKSPITALLQLPPITKQSSKNMPIHQPERPVDNGALIAAIQAQSAEEINSMNAITAAIASGEVPESTYRQETRFNATIAPQELATLNPLRRALMISTTCANHTYRFYSASSAFEDLTYLVELVGANAQWEVPVEMCQQPIWMSCDTDGNALVNDQPVDVLVTEILAGVPAQ